MTVEEKKALLEKVDEYVDRLQDLNEAKEFDGVRFSESDNIFVAEGIEKMIEAIGSSEVETEKTVQDRYYDGKIVKWIAEWKRFYYRGIRFAGIIYYKPLEDVR